MERKLCCQEAETGGKECRSVYNFYFDGGCCSCGSKPGETPDSGDPDKPNPDKPNPDPGDKPGSGGSLNPDDVYEDTRPEDWLPMPEPQDDEMYLLAHIPNGASSLLAFAVTCTGNYTVEFGTVVNGTFVQKSITTVANQDKYQTELFADDYEHLTSTGMKQIIVKVSGKDITTWTQREHSKKTVPIGYSGWNIVEISCRLPKGENIKWGKLPSGHALKNLAYFSWYGSNMLTNASNMFQNCSALKVVRQLDTSGVTDMSSMFEECGSLLSVPLLNTATVINMSRMFYSCVSLTASQQFDVMAVTNTSSMFENCMSLVYVPELKTTSATDMRSMFRNCSALINAPTLETASATNMSNMFSGCKALTMVPKLDTSSATQIESMFMGCSSLVSVLGIDISASSRYYSMFSGCDALASIRFVPSEMIVTPGDMSLAGCSLGHAALVELFKSLPIIKTTKKLSIGGNPGVTSLTTEDLAIATNKGWTLGG